MNTDSILDVLATPVAAIRAPDAQAIVRDVFGIGATARPLTSERDQNFYLLADDRSEYVLKIANPAEDPTVTNFQTQALMHIAAADPDVPVPRVVPASNGALETLLRVDAGPPRVVRLLSFLPGTPLSTFAAITPTMRRRQAQALARLGRALRGFGHPAAAHELLWDLKQAGRVRPLLAHIEDAADRRLASRFLQDFEERVLPVLPGLRTQVVHNDLNFFNVVVDPRDPEIVTGIIDFGDMVETALVCDVAVAAAYQVADGPNGIETAALFVGAYHEVTPLEPAELDILFDLIATRSLLTVAITGWRAARFPQNRHYILRNNSRAWAWLRYFDGLPRSEARRILRQACHVE